MPGDYLLDTNIVIGLFKADSEIEQRLAGAAQVSLSVITLGELIYGAHRSLQRKKNLSRIHELAARTGVLGCDSETGRLYGEIKARLHDRGRPLPENDIWIAAIASRYRLMLATRDKKHFAEIEGLSWETW